MKTSLVLLTACVFVGAAVPRVRRALNSEELLRSTWLSSTTVKPAEEQKTHYCAPQTPCAWSFYKPESKIIDVNVINTYCECSPDQHCQISEDDSTVKAFVHRCRPVAEAEEADEEPAQS